RARLRRRAGLPPRPPAPPPPPVPRPVPSAPPCGEATFSGGVLPLSWNPTYVGAWRGFLGAVAQRYNANPDLASIAVDGPTSASAEMGLPNTSADTQAWVGLLALFYPAGPYQDSNQAFIDQWESTIGFYGAALGAKALVLTAGNLVNFRPGVDDATTAQSAIWGYFTAPGTSVGTNAKALQISNLRSCRTGGGGFSQIKADTISPGVVG